MQIKSNYYKKISSLFFVFLLASIFIFSSFAKAISTSAQISFKTADVIMVNDTAYPFVGWYSGNEIKTDTNDKVYRAYQKDTSCKDFIAVQKNTAEVRLINANKSNTSTNKSCSYSSWSESEKLSNIKDLSNRYIIYYWQDKNTIVRLSSGFNGTQIGSVSYSRENDSSKFIENTSGNCKDEININSSTDGSYIARSQTSEDQIISWNSDGREVKEKADKQVAGCYETKSVGVKLGYSENSDKKPEDATQVPGTVDTGSGPGDDAAQESNCSQALSPFGWVLCPATNFADNLYSFFKQLVNNLLFFESDKYEDNGLYASWKIMVTLANTVLVLVAIVMIAAQIFNFDFISAYTVKKALPRIVIAAILIQLSWFMVTTGIQIVNAIGSGMYWLLVAPFTQNIDAGDSGGVLEIGPILAQNYSGTDKGNTVGNAVVFYYAMVGLGAAAVGAALSGLWISIIIAAIGVVISLLVAIVTLVIREVLLIVLIAIAPLAIAFWILPGTNGLWNMWWKTFSRLLLMYPLIMLLFAGGTIAAILLASTGSGINILFAIIAFFVPMFMIGATYKFAGGAFASIANMTGKLGDKAKGSGMFGLKETAKRKREQSPWSLASQARKEQHRIEANKKFADLLGKDSPYGAVLRRKSGGGNVETIIARAQQQQIKDKSEDIDRIVSGDTSVLRDIVNNTARGPASAFNNDTYARIAAFQQLAKMGKTDASDFSSIGRMLRDDDVLRNKIVGDAAFTSGQAGNLTDGKIQSVSGTGEITYKDRIPDSASATANAIRNMPQEQLRFLATETVRDPKTGRDIDRFKDTNTRTYFDTREGAAYAVQLLTDPASSQNLTVNQKNVLRQQALRHGLTIPSSPNSGATQVPNPPHGPGTSGGTP